MISTRPETLRPASEIFRTAWRLFRTSLLDCLPWSLAVALSGMLIWHMVEAGIWPLYRAVENRVQVVLLSEDSSELLNYLLQSQSSSLLNSTDVLRAQAQTAAFFSAASFWLPCALYCLVGIGCWNALMLRIHFTADKLRPRFVEILSVALRKIPGAIFLLLLLVLVSSMEFLPTFANGTLFLLWLILQVVLGFYLAGILLLAWVPIVNERFGVWGSIKKCHVLMKDNWWRAVTILSVVLLVPVLLALVAAVLAGSILSMAGLGEQGISGGQQLAGLGALVLFQPLIPAVFVAVYQELQQIKARGEQLS